MELKNLGIFGGSFDPIHNGHIKISLLAQKQLHLDILLFIPVYDPGPIDIAKNFNDDNEILFFFIILLNNKGRFLE